MGPWNHVLDGGPDPPWKGVVFRGKGMPSHARRHFDVSCAKLLNPMETPFGLWTRVDGRKHVLDGGPLTAGLGPYGIYIVGKCIQFL